tara:strand:- start:2785 stop:3438 length:654 start_codon:yes stop_codon:yes gene_type:complete
MKEEFIKRLLSSLILIPIALFFIIKGSIFFNFFLLFFFLVTFYEWHTMSNKKPYYFFGLFYLIFSFYTVYDLIDFDGNYNYFLLILLICISTDIGGYVFGNIFKGPKLTKISPKKTYSGMIGGYVLSIISIYIIFNYTYLFLDKTKFTIDIFIFILVISSISQIGDLVISYFKRLSKVKDTGKIIPGHGGLLDRIDGMIFAYPFAYLILKLNIFKYF